MFPRSAVGSVTGIGGMAGAVGGCCLCYYTGYILQFTHSYAILFAHRRQRLSHRRCLSWSCLLPD